MEFSNPNLLCPCHHFGSLDGKEGGLTMADLIDRQAAKELICATEVAFNTRLRGPIKAKFAAEIGRLLDTLSAVEVVHCAKCIYSNSCEIEGMLIGDGIENPYCAGGERRADNG